MPARTIDEERPNGRKLRCLGHPAQPWPARFATMNCATTVPERRRVLIVDDHPLVRLGLQTRLGSQEDLVVCGQAATAEDAVALARSLDPDLVVLDLALKGASGLDTIKRLRAAGIGAPIVIYSAYDESLFAERALRAGAQGYVNKQEASGSLLDAVRTVLRGDIYVSPMMLQKIAAQVLRGRTARSGTEALSEREMQVFILIGEGLGTREIAEQLHVSIHTVESHRENIRAKLNLRNGTELMRHATHWALDASR
jgi:DNA-binding NarL/FixJ family response regulator